MNSNNKIDMPSLAKSSTGVFDFKKYLYDAGLSNIYEDYQSNIGSLDMAKQQQIQDAYTIREMSKKYLGEYASDRGIGNVSGSLLDIYGQYQSNIKGIGQQFDTQKLSLEQEYRTNRFNMLSQQLENQYNLEVAKLDNLAQDVISNIAIGETGGLSPLEYVVSQKENLAEDTYSALYQQTYVNTVEDIISQMSSNPRNIDSILSQYESVLTPQKYQDLQELGEQFKLTQDLLTPQSYRDSSSDIYDPNYDPSYTFSGNENIGKESDVFIIGGKEYAEVLDDVDSDANAKTIVDSFSLTQDFQEKFGASPNPGEITQYMGNYYVLKQTPQGATWHRLTTSSGSKISFDAAFLTKDTEGNPIPNKEVQENWGEGFVSYKTNNSGRDTFEYNDNIYREDKTDTRFKSNTTDPKQQEIISKFREVHGDKKNVVIYWDGKFWVHNRKGYTVMNKLGSATKQQQQENPFD
jgi:hypothetical protein